MIRAAKIAFLLSYMFAIPFVCFSQTQQQGESDQPIKLSTELVVLDVQVLNRKTGQIVSNLSKEDFSVYEDGVKQSATHFSQDKLPLSVVILLDTSGSVWPIMKQLRQRTIEALQQLKTEDEVGLIATASKTAVIQDFTKDRQLTVDKINTIDEKALGDGGILLHEALYQAAVYLRSASNPASRRVIIVITDNISTQLPSKGHSEKEALLELLESGSAVCGLTVETFGSKSLKYDPTFFVLKKLLLKGDIKSYAEKTGGLVLKSKKEDIATKLAEIINRLRTRYTLGYIPTNTKRDGKFRKIRLLVSPDVEKREGKFAILTKRGYYTRQDQNTAITQPR